MPPVNRRLVVIAILALVTLLPAESREVAPTNIVARILLDGLPNREAGAIVSVERDGKKSSGVAIGELLLDGTRITAPPHVTILIQRTDRKADILLEPGTTVQFVATSGAGQIVHQGNGNALFSVVPHALDFYRVTFRQFIASVRGTVFAISGFPTSVTFASRRGRVDVEHNAQTAGPAPVRPKIRSLGNHRQASLTKLVVFSNVSSGGSLRSVDTITPGQRSLVTYHPNSVVEAPLGSILRYKLQLSTAVQSGDADRIGASYNNLGLAYDRSGQLSKAIVAFTQAILRNPLLSVAYYNRANSYRGRNNQRAFSDYANALRLDSCLTYAYNNRGLLFSDTGDDRRAIEDYNRAIFLDPKLAEAYNNRGISFESLGQHKQALRDYAVVLNLDPKHSSAFLNRGNTYFALEDYDRALSDYNRAIYLSPQLAQAYVGRGSVYHRLENNAKALADFDVAIKLDPKDALAYAKRGNVYLQSGHPDQAIVDLDVAIRLKPNFSLFIAGRGAAKFELHDYDGSAVDFRKAVDLAPDNESLRDLSALAFYISDAVSHFHKQDYDQAIGDLTKSLQYTNGDLKNKTSTVLYLRGILYQLKRNHDQAIVDFSKSLELDPADAAAYAARGESFLQLDEVASAIADFDAASALGPTSVAVLVDRAVAYDIEGHYTSALVDFNHAITLDPKSAFIYAKRATMFLHSNDNTSALRDYDKALELESKDAGTFLERGIARYYTVDSKAAAREDFVQAAQLSPTDPYIAIWLEIANRRMRLPSQLTQAVPHLDMNKWPAPVVQMFIGASTPAGVLEAAMQADPSKVRGDTCEAYFYGAEYERLSGTQDAVASYRSAATLCPHGFTEWTAAIAALRALKLAIP